VEDREKFHPAPTLSLEYHKHVAMQKQLVKLKQYGEAQKVQAKLAEIEANDIKKFNE